MATTATVVTLCFLSFCGFAIAADLPPQVAGELPWKELTNGSAAVLMLVALVVVLRYVVTMHAAATAEREAAAKARDAAEQSQREHVEKVTSKFAETTTTLFAAVREDAAAARRELQDIVRDRIPR
jgi:type VI protein secretion system component VasK